MGSTSEGWKKRRPKTVVDYIFNKIDVQENGCWFWKGAKPRRYGSFDYNREVGSAPRKVYEKLVGPIPEELCALHKCDDHRCVNPEHIYPGTKKQNRQDFMQRHPRARELLVEGAKRAGKGTKRKWDSMTPEERRVFIETRKEKQMIKHPPGSESRLRQGQKMKQYWAKRRQECQP